MSLTQEQIESFHDDGFLVVDDLFAESEVGDLRAACSEPVLVEAQSSKGYAEKTVHLLLITTYHDAFMDLAKDRRMIDRIRPLTGDDIQLEHSKLATKPPARGKGPFHWHQDFAFFPYTNTDLVAVMVMLDDATPENGCMQIVRGSHRLGLLDHMVDGFFTGACQESDTGADEDRIVDILPRAGGISIHHCLALHGSEPNVSGHPRRGLVYQYRADDAYQLADSVFEDRGILVSGKRRERVRCEEGVFRLPKRNRSEHPFGSVWNQDGPIARQRDYGFDADAPQGASGS